MVYLIYVLYFATAVLLGAAVWRAVADDRSTAMKLVIAAIITAGAAAILSWNKIGGEINEKGYERVRTASSQSSEADAMAQWALGDGVITVSEYAAIAEAYQQQTGRDINEEDTE